MRVLSGTAGVADACSDDSGGNAKQRVVGPEAAHAERGLLRRDVHIVQESGLGM